MRESFVVAIDVTVDADVAAAARCSGYRGFAIPEVPLRWSKCASCGAAEALHTTSLRDQVKDAVEHELNAILARKERERVTRHRFAVRNTLPR